MSTDRIQRLQLFVDWSKAHITGDEKGQAQIFLDRLFQAFGQPGSLDVGGKPEFRIKPGEEDEGGTAFADYVWKAQNRPGVLIEMKKRGVDLAKHRQQAFNYWIKLVPGRPQYTVLCNFDEFWIYDFDVDLDEPRDKLTLAQLPERYGPLAFLFPTNESPTFDNDRIEVTRKAADRLASAFYHMVHIRNVDRDLAQRFILQLLVALFAEDIDLIPKYFVANLLKDIKTPEDSYDSFGGLFEAMNRKGGTPAGRFKPIPYFNGGLFTEPAKLALDNDGIELAHLREAARENWSKVSPDIFGTLFQHSMDEGERHAYGAHYTAPIDIMKIVYPTIVEPWTTLIDTAKSPKQLADLLERLSLYKVLDPACGSGNFLYIAYRELKRLESKIRDRLRTEFPAFQATLYHVKASQFYGLDILPFAIELAKVTMMLARKLAIDELHIADEPPLPLDNLDQNFHRQDALLTPTSPGIAIPGSSTQDSNLRTQNFLTPWPPADVIIGNPPFLGAKRLKPERGPDYVNALRNLYPEVPGMADYCVYWFKRAHDHLPLCTPDRPESGRAGLVGTQNIRNNQSRVGGLDHIVKTGAIIEAVENQPWSGEANVHVSIANWVKTNVTRASRPPLPPPPEAVPTTKPAMASPVPVAQPPSAVSPPSLAASQRDASSGPEDRNTSSSARKGREKSQKNSPSPEGATPLNPATSNTNPPPAPPDPAPQKLLIPAQKKLWHKIDPKLALFTHSKTRAPAVTTTGKRGKIRQDKSYELDFRLTTVINSALSDETDVASKRTLICNQRPKVCFQGKVLGYEGFLLTSEQAERIRQDSAAVVRPILTGRELLNDFRIRRWVIDFQDMDINEASKFRSAFERCRKCVLPEVRKSYENAVAQRNDMTLARKEHMERWWQFWNRRDELNRALDRLPKYLACSRVTRRPIFVFVSSAICPSDALQVFAFADDYSFGILQSNLHYEWLQKSSRLKVDTDLRYSSRDVFETFPWPQHPTTEAIRNVASAARSLQKMRSQMTEERNDGLRGLYRLLELPGRSHLKAAHENLDEAVRLAYGLSASQDFLEYLLDLNQTISQCEGTAQAVRSPGLPCELETDSELFSPFMLEPADRIPHEGAKT